MSLTTAPQVEFETPSFAGIFPLALTPMEAFMVADGRENYPMLCDIELQFQGSIERGAFDTALELALARNPLLRSLVERGRGGAPVWVPTDRTPAVDWADWDTPIAGQYGQFIDLARDIGFRIWVRHGSDKSRILFNFHHACCDGVGFMGFCEDFLAAYAAAVPGGVAVQPRPLNPESLKRRGLIGIPKRSGWQSIGDVFVGAAESIRFLLGAPLSLPARVEPAAAVGHVVSRCHVFTGQTVVALRRLAGQGGATLNDLLIRDLMATLRRWYADGGREPRRRRLRVLMPQNLREREDVAMPAANAMSFAFVTRRADCCDDPPRLLTSIRDETEAIRRYKLSLYFLGGIAMMQATGLLNWLLKRKMCFATAVLTNLGDLTRRFVARFPRSPEGLQVGNLVLTGAIGMPPVRPLTRSVWAVCQTASTLTICLKCDPQSFSPLDVERLLGEYVKQLLDSARGATPEQQTISAESGLS